MFRWHPSNQRTSTSTRPDQRTAPSRLLSNTEDAQPNEFVEKRKRRPPAISKVATQQQQPWRVRHVPRQEMRFVSWEPSGSMRQAAGGSASSHARRPPDHRMTAKYASAPSALPSEAPAPKRRKLEGSPISASNCTLSTQGIVPAGTPSASSVSSETLVGERKVKREHSASPELSAKPQLITTGSKRYAPLPPECQKSQSNHKAARWAWAKREQEALKKLGLKVVRTFIREDGMVIDWEIDASESAATPAIIEPALSINHAAVPKSFPPSVKSTMLSPTHIPLHQPCSEREASTPSPFMVEVEHGGTAKSAGVTQSSGPSRELHQERERQPQGHPAVNHAVNVPTPIGRLRKLPEDSARNTPSLSHRTRSPDPPQQRTASPQHPVPHLPPSQSAIDTLQHILRLKRKLDRDPDLPEPSIASMSSKPVRKLYPVPKTPQSGSLSRRSPTSSAADVVAAAINEGTQLHRVRHGSIPIPSTPSPRKRPSLFATPVSNKGSSAPQADEGHRTRRSLSLGRYSSPPILFLDPTKSASQSQKPSQGPYREEEYDELELSYPASLTLAPQRDLPDSRPPMVIPTESPRRAKIVSPTSRPSFLDTGSHWIGDSALMRSSELHYFERYCQIFDMDRRALADVYAPDAVFSCSSRNLHARGRDDVVEALQALGHGVLCSGSSVEYDVTWLGPGVGVLLVVLGTMRQSGESNGEVGYAMTFVLKSDGDNDERPTGDVRPLVAVVHQMVFRESLSQSR